MFTTISCRDFATELASDKPVPGGGGTAAYVAALGTALNTMVANFSLKNKKLTVHKEQHQDLIKRGNILRERLVELIDKDAELFEPLSKAFKLPSDTDEEIKYKDEVLQENLKLACIPPMEILELSYDAVVLHKEIEDISSDNIISDIAVGVQCLKAALNSAYINVLININSITDVEYVSAQKEKAEKILADGTRLADEVYDKVLNKLTN